MTRGLALILLAGALAPCALAAEANLQPVAERLASPQARDRVRALADLRRLKPTGAKARPLLERGAADAAPEVRLEAASVAADLLGAGAIDLLRPLAADQERTVRETSVRLLCRMWEEAEPREACRGFLGSADVAVRAQAFAALREAAPTDPLAVRAFRAGLDDRAPIVQRAAVLGLAVARDADSAARLGRIARTAPDLVAEPIAAEALPTIGGGEAIDALAALLPRPAPGDRPSDVVRCAALVSLGRIGAVRAAAAVRPLLADSAPLVRAAAATAAARLGDQAAVPALAGRLADAEPAVRLAALAALRRLGATRAAPEVRRLLGGDPVPAVRAAAAAVLADLAGSAAIPDLAARRGDESPAVRLEAAGALAGLGRPAAASLTAFVADPRPDVRKTAVVALGQFGGVEALPAIAGVAADAGRANLGARVAAAEALGDIRRVEGIPILERLAADPEPSVRQAAAGAFGTMSGSGDPRVRRALERLLQDPAAGVRSAARRALETAPPPAPSAS